MTENATEYSITYMVENPQQTLTNGKVEFSINIEWEEIDVYNVTWKNYDGSTITTGTVPEGEMPVYTGATPTRPSVGNTTYTFNGWTPTIVAATTDAVYTATYLEERPYMASIASAYSSRVAISYIDTNSSSEDQSKLPTGTTEAYVFDWSSFASGINITNTIKGNFEAGKTYIVIISIRHISTSASSWNYKETVDGTFMTDTKIQWWNGVTESVHVIDKTFTENATELKTIYQLENNGADTAELEFAISVSYREVLSYEASSNTSSATLTYIDQNSSEDMIANLPTDTTEGYLIACNMGENGDLRINNTIRDNFEAGKTYAFTFKIHHISGTVPTGSACWEIFINGETVYFSTGSMAGWNKNGTHTINVTFDVAASIYETELKIYNGNGVGDLKCTIAFSWSEVVAE